MNNNKAFTLYELVIVVAIISVMTGMLWASFDSFKSKLEANSPTYYTDIVPPDIVDYESILKSYGIELSREEMDDLIRALKNGD